MMTEQKRYNGWTNYETWCVSLWMSNDCGSYEHCREMAREAWQDAEGDASITRKERAAIDLADTLKAEWDEGNPLTEAGPYADLLGAALSEVNWYEIAEHLIGNEDLTEECEDCGGSGQIKCEHCKGLGVVAGADAAEEECPQCLGDGENDCPACEGKGEKPAE